MKTKIMNALKTEYAKMGLSDKAFDGVASFLVKTITKEEDIDGVIKSEDTKNLLKAFQGESDSLRNKAAQLQKDLDAYKESHPDTTVKPKTKGEETDDDIPAWAKSLIARFDERDEREKRETALSAIKSRLEADGCTNKGILNSTLKGFSLGEKETEDQAVERLMAEYNQSYKDTFGSGPVPHKGGGGQGEDDKAFQKSLEAYADSKGLGENKK